VPNPAVIPAPVVNPYIQPVQSAPAPVQTVGVQAGF